MSFAAPDLLFGLLAVPFAALGYWVLERRRSQRAAPWSRDAMLPNMVRRPPRRLGYVPVALFLLGLTFLLVGFARPQRIHNSSVRQAPTIVLAVDVSGSMAANDAPSTRIGAARAVAIQFLHELPPAYRVALVTFGNKVDLAVGPTFGHKSVIAKLPTAVTPLAGTGIGDAVVRAVSVIVNAAGETGSGGVYRPGAVLLLSDGGQTAGGTTPQEAAISALVDYVPVDTVAVGTSRGVVTQPVKLNDLEISAEIPVPVDLTTLRSLSQQTGGTSFEAASVAQSPAQLASIYKNLRSSISHNRRTHALNAIATGVALFFILAGLALSGLWLGRLT